MSQRTSHRKEQQMKLKITEIEATAEELRQSNSLADGLHNLLRNALNPYVFHIDDDEGADDEQAD